VLSADEQADTSHCVQLGGSLRLGVSPLFNWASLCFLLFDSASGDRFAELETNKEVISRAPLCVFYCSTRRLFARIALVYCLRASPLSNTINGKKGKAVNRRVIASA
jgi:hypothetical protein